MHHYTLVDYRITIAAFASGIFISLFGLICCFLLRAYRVPASSTVFIKNLHHATIASAAALSTHVLAAVFCVLLHINQRNDYHAAMRLSIYVSAAIIPVFLS